MTRQVSPVSGTTTYLYDEHGELTSETDARGVTASRTVDALDRVTAVTDPDSSLDTLYTYDNPDVLFSKGRLTNRSTNKSRSPSDPNASISTPAASFRTRPLSPSSRASRYTQGRNPPPARCHGSQCGATRKGGTRQVAC